MSACTQPTRSLALHGGVSQQLIIGNEKQSDFDALLNQLLDDHQPDTTQSRLFVEDVALARWFLWRRQRAPTAPSKTRSTPPLQTKETGPLIKPANSPSPSATAHRLNAASSALSISWKPEKTRRRDREHEARKAQWEANYALRERRLALQEQKFELAKTKSQARTVRFAKNAVSSPSYPKQNALARSLQKQDNPLRPAAIQNGERSRPVPVERMSGR
jgi:hypothetical protein